MQHCVAITQALINCVLLKGVRCETGGSRSGPLGRYSHFMSCLHSLPAEYKIQPRASKEGQDILKTAINRAQCLQFANYRLTCEPMRQVAARLIYIIKFLFYNLSIYPFSPVPVPESVPVHNWKRDHENNNYFQGTSCTRAFSMSFSSQLWDVHKIGYKI